MRMTAMEKEDTTDYSPRFKPVRQIWVIKKDKSREAFNVQKVIDAVGKSAYRALTKFTDQEKEHICRYVIEIVEEMG